MKGRSIFILFLLFSVLAWSGLEAQSGAAKGKGRVRGKVTDPQGKGLPAATVRFASAELDTSFEIKTDDKGEWVVNGIAGGSWDLDFAKEGYQVRRITVGIQTLSFNKPIEIALQPAKGRAPSTAVTSDPSAPAAAADPSKALVQQGTVLADEKKFPEAIAKYEEAIRLNPSMYLLYGEIGNFYLQMDQPDKAIESYKKVLEKEATNQNARLALVTALLNKKDIAEAKKILEAVDLNTITNANTLYEIGVRFYNAQETKEAIRYWEKAVAMDPKMGDAYVQLGAAYVAVGDNDKARQMLNKAIELDPASDNAKMAKEMLDSMQ
jgi:tetratricopeptide (TPR) repeat protein